MTENQPHGNDRIMQLDPDKIKRYLIANKWNCIHTYPDGVSTLWEKGNATVRHIPDKTLYSDYRRLVDTMLRTAAEVEKTDVEHVIKAINALNVDILKIHLPEPIGSDGTIPLDDATRIIDGIRKLISSATSTAEDIAAGITPKEEYSEQKSANVKAANRNLRLGQTEVGSYVITVESEVVPDSNQTTLNATPKMPLERMALVTLAGALTAVKEYRPREPAEGDDTDIITEAARRGVSANLCDNLSEISQIQQENKHTGLDIEFRWAPEYPVEPETPSRIEITPDKMNYVAKVVDKRILAERKHNITLTGHVKGLSRSKTEETGKVTIETNVKNGPQTVTVYLAGEDYEKAIKAHGKGYVLTVSGDLVKANKKYYTIENPHDVEADHDADSADDMKE